MYLYLMAIIHDSRCLGYTSNVLPMLKKNNLNRTLVVKAVINIIQGYNNLVSEETELIFKCLVKYFPETSVQIDHPEYYLSEYNEIELRNMIANGSGHGWIANPEQIINNNDIKLVIAGGSVINSLFNRTLPRYSDVDLWITGGNIKSRTHAWYLTIKYIWEQCPKPTIISVKGAVATIVPPQPKLPIQVILTECNNIEAVISHFDMDYLMALVG